MKPILILLAALSLSPLVQAAGDPAWYGEPNCKIAEILPHPQDGAVKWSGACKDGYAEGQGILEWSVAGQGEFKLEAALVRGEIAGEGNMTGKFGSYTGTFRHGKPDGQGYFKLRDGRQYEGAVVNGTFEGTGIAVDEDGSHYDGQWKNGKRNGYGKQVYTLGGSYDGEWKDDKFDGKGVIVYTGSGRRYEGLFREGRVADAAHVSAEQSTHILKGNPATGSHIGPTIAIGYGPLDATWQQLTPGQQSLVKSFYKTLEDGDEPPYPLHGTGKVYADIARVRNAAFLRVTGDLRAYIRVGTDGKPQSVIAFGVTDPEFKRFMSSVLMLQEFKHAICHGEPCEMIYPIRFSFTLGN